MPAHAQDTARQLHDAERARAAELATQNEADSRRVAAQAEASRLAAQRVQAAAKLRAAEAAASQAAAQMDALEQRRSAARKLRDDRAADLQPLLPLIERLALFPAETLLAVPAPPAETLRGVLVLRGLTRQIAQDAATAQREQTKVESLSHDMAAEASRLAAAQQTQQVQATALDQQIAGAQRAAQVADDASAGAARRAADLAARADSLRGAIATIEQQHQADEAKARDDAAHATQDRRDGEAAEAKRRQVALAAPAGPGLIEPRNQLTSPVAGAVVTGFGDAGESGPATGMSYRAPPGARVVSPCAGTAVFAGPFRSFGLLLIVDCGGGYHFVLSGFARLDETVGRPVQAGEPVGVMPGWDPRNSPATARRSIWSCATTAPR